MELCLCKRLAARSSRGMVAHPRGGHLNVVGSQILGGGGRHHRVVAARKLEVLGEAVGAVGVVEAQVGYLWVAEGRFSPRSGALRRIILGASVAVAWRLDEGGSPAPSRGAPAQRRRRPTSPSRSPRSEARSGRGRRPAAGAQRRARACSRRRQRTRRCARRLRWPRGSSALAPMEVPIALPLRSWASRGVPIDAPLQPTAPARPPGNKKVEAARASRK